MTRTTAAAAEDSFMSLVKKPLRWKEPNNFTRDGSVINSKKIRIGSTKQL
jgi:hypothetical protein